jgi:hypothetical protein
LKSLHPDLALLASAVVAVVVVVAVVLADSAVQLDQLQEINLVNLLITADQATRLILDVLSAKILLDATELEAKAVKLLTLQANHLTRAINLLLPQIDSVNPAEKEILDAPEIQMKVVLDATELEAKAVDLPLPPTDQAVVVIDATKLEAEAVLDTTELFLAEAVNFLTLEAKLLAVNPMINVSAKTEELATNVLVTTDLVAINVLVVADHLAEAEVLPTPVANQVVASLAEADQVAIDLVEANHPAEVAQIAPDKYKLKHPDILGCFNLIILLRLTKLNKNAIFYFNHDQNDCFLKIL